MKNETSLTPQVPPPEAQRSRKRLVIMITAIFVVVIYGVFFYGTKRLTWTEELALADGSTVTVERKQTVVSTSYELFQKSWQTKRNQITFPDGVLFDTSDHLGGVNK